MEKYQIALCQDSYKEGDIESNMSLMESRIHSCMERYPNVKIILFSELSTSAYYLSPPIVDVAQNQQDSIFSRFSSIASSYNIYVVYGYVERGNHGEIYNSTMIIGPNGSQLGNYRKIHLTPLEKEIFTPGESPVVIDTELGKIGVMVCWDLAFPEMSVFYSNEQVDLILAPSAWERPYNNPFHRFGMARAIDSTVYLAACNQIGEANDLSFFGQSVVYGPDGTNMVNGKDGTDDLIVTEIDLSWRKRLKTTFFTMVEDRRGF